LFGIRDSFLDWDVVRAGRRDGIVPGAGQPETRGHVSYRRRRIGPLSSTERKGSRMKAVVYKGPYAVEVEDVSDAKFADGYTKVLLHPAA
jgi:hypothetical protein